MLFVHEDTFRGRYLADVAKDSGALIVGPVGSAADAIVRLEADPPPRSASGVLAAPFAGFQVVDALAGLMTNAPLRAGPRRRGH